MSEPVLDLRAISRTYVTEADRGASVAIGNPADGYYVIKDILNSGGWAASATDPQIIDAIKLLARTQGIFTEPAGGTTLACAIKLIQQGKIPKDESICVCITGNGLKTLEVMENQFQAAPVIKAKIKEFDEVIVQGNTAAATA